MEKSPLYIQLYEYYKQLILAGTLKANTKLPSIRRCALERCVSRTTVEEAYAQLAAEGYVKAQPGSGFYVNSLDYRDIKPQLSPHYEKRIPKEKILYDFSSARVDPNSFNFDVWRRYIKSALRNTERLLSYGDTQGEYDLRVALADYVRERRGVACTPEQIVVGAGMQPLLHILCSLTGNKSKVAFTGNGFKQGKVIFEERGYETLDYGELTEDFTLLEQEKVKMLYTSPSHVTPWGDVMPMQTRLALLAFAKKKDCLILEDDYDSEFNYYNRPTPSLQGLDGGDQVIYMSTFSKLLLPSLRLSFMVLPKPLMDSYRQKGHQYNQTASKAEQIALCQFIRDGHLQKQIKKAKKLYMHKQHLLCKSIEEVFENQAEVVVGASGFLVQLELKTSKKAEELVALAAESGILLRASGEAGGKWPKILLSCSGLDEVCFDKVLNIMKNKFFCDRIK